MLARVSQAVRRKCFDSVDSNGTGLLSLARPAQNSRPGLPSAHTLLNARDGSWFTLSLR